MKTKSREFWITNISKKDVRLADLSLHIPAGKNMNLLDSRHFHYTEEQLEESKNSGSLSKKSKLIKVRKVEPEPPLPGGKYVSKVPIFMKYKVRGIDDIEEPYFEELQVSEEKFADELTDDGGNPFED